jgi:pimeloyl-ACP methyl ester carboxylesterase
MMLPARHHSVHSGRYFGPAALFSMLSIAAVLVLAAPLHSAAPSAQEEPTTFVVTLQGVRIGSETMRVTRQGGTIRISMSGAVGAPVGITTTRFEMTYGTDWQPQQLFVEAAVGNESIGIGTTFGVTTAVSDMTQGTRRGSITHNVSPRTIVLPANFFSAYAALAARLSSFPAGSKVPIYVAPEGEIQATVNRVTPKQLSNPSGTTDVLEYDITLHRPSLPLAVIVQVDKEGRLARVAYRDLAFGAIREDLASVMTREVRVRHANDEDVFMPAAGFSLAATITKPASSTGRAPAVILVGGPGRQDRDETLYGVPIFGQLAGHLADAGYFVVRYDKRGVGQSGGRPEHAGLPEYAEDVAGIVEWLRRRRDVDGNRIAVVTHAEGSAVGLTAAGRAGRIKAVALLGAPGLSGRETVLEQQRRALERRKEPEGDRQVKIALQTRVMDAVVTGKGLDELPPDLQRQAASPWFKGWLQFDPAAAMKRVNQPVFVLHGALDQEMPPSHGERLNALATARRGAAATQSARVVVPGVNHLLVEAKTGDLEEYDALGPARISREVVSALTSWLAAALK